MGWLTTQEMVDFVRIMEVGLLGLTSAIFITDVHHGGMSQEMRMKFNYPRWLTPIVGVVQFLIASLSGMTWYGDDKGLQWASHRMVAILMGGCIYTHVAVAKRWKDASGAVLFLAFSIIVPWAEGREQLDYVLPAHLSLAACGWLVGTIITRSQPGWREWKPPVWVPDPPSSRPVKKKRGLFGAPPPGSAAAAAAAAKPKAKAAASAESKKEQ